MSNTLQNERKEKKKKGYSKQTRSEMNCSLLTEKPNRKKKKKKTF